MAALPIVIDAMGGDYAPDVVLQGVELAMKEDADIRMILVGDTARIEAALTGLSVPKDRYEIVHTSEFVTMDEKPRDALHDKPDASIRIAMQLLADNKGSALMSAGNTGGTVLAASQILKKLPGIERGVLAAILPAGKNTDDDPGRTVMIDVGATLHCTPNQLVSFAIMGIHYARAVMGVQNPRVGLLNIGEEDTKGHEVLVETHRMLKEIEGGKFIGNVEGKDIMNGLADIIVTEGFVGNVVLKTIEGLAEMGIRVGRQIWGKNLLTKAGLMMLSPVLKKLKKRLDYSEYGGAPILGFQNLVVKAHGRSNAKAIKNAIHLAQRSATANLAAEIEEAMKQWYMHMFEHPESEPDLT